MVTILQGDCLEVLKTLPSESVHCVISSPPYWGLRDYSVCSCIKIRPRERSGIALVPRGGHDPNLIEPSEVHAKPAPDPDCSLCRGTGRDKDISAKQMGLENTPDEYVAKLVEVFREVRRVLRRDGTCFIVLGDSFYGSGKGGGGSYAKDGMTRSNSHSSLQKLTLKPKDLVGIPWRVAFALQADGWWLRSDIIYAKSNPMPESVTDRPTRSHEYVFLLSKSQTYYYDHEAIKEPSTGRLDVGNMNIEARLDSGAPWQNKAKQALTAAAMPDSARAHRLDGFNARWDASEANGTAPSGRNRRTVWEIPTQPSPAAPFAMYPEALVLPCIQAGTSEHGCCAECGAPWRR